ncbi:MAG: PSD1 and planctomycete cytochrome C domain-containing protein [Isosphaeraceae bacterium]
MPRIVVFAALATLGAGSAPGAEPPPVFERDVLPVLKARCLKCHGEAHRKGGLSLRTPAAMLDGGDNGPAFVRGKADESLIVEQVESGAMPPGKSPKLSPAEVATIKSWVAAGAPSDGSAAADKSTDEDAIHWAFRPPARPAVPAVPGAANAIDAFLLARLREQNLEFSPEADRRTLIRRATYDLWGLPPTEEEVDAFLADRAPDAYERLVDRLLASPRYGERWGRHWLDIAGYADSEGILAADHVRSAAWRYRDWVVRAFNADVPYDRFLRLQIAGDEIADYWKAYRNEKALSPEVVDALEATGYLRCAGDTSRPDFVNIKNAPGYYYQTLDDTVKIVASSVMGLTLQCARCHSHKYDPVTQAEYYRVQAVFMSGYRPMQWVPQVERRRSDATAAQEAEAKTLNESIDRAVARRTAALDALRNAFAARLFEERLATLPVSEREDVRKAIEADPAKRTPAQKNFVQKYQARLTPSPRAVLDLMARNAPRDRDIIRSLEALNTTDSARRKSFSEIRAFYDLPGEAKTPILQRGDYLKPGQEVSPGVVRSLATPEPFRWSPPAKDAPTSGRRRAFAEWLTQPGHPLTARVLVNRVWLHHFGEGIVATPDNFGVKGEPPSHPELLDWLATEFVRQGWSLKTLHRMMMTSAAYRQSSRDDPQKNALARSTDPENRLLWRQRLRRLEAEALRDAVLCVAGTLNPAAGGPPVPMVGRADGEVVAPEGPEGARRSVYLQVRRSQPLTFLQVFDQPVMETNCTRRSTSTVSSQALSLLNSEFLSRQAERLAARVLREAPSDPSGRAVLLAFGRPATDRERTLLTAYLARQGPDSKDAATPPAALVDVCQMLLSSNEFAYVD